MSKINYSFLPIPRFFYESNWYKNPKMAIFILWCFGRCSADRREIYHDHKLVVLEPFEFIFGRRICSEETGLSEKSIRTLIGQLRATKIGEILKKSASKSTSKFSVYRWSTELFSESMDQQKGQQLASKWPQSRSEELKNIEEALSAKEELPLLPISPPLQEEEKIIDFAAFAFSPLMDKENNLQNLREQCEKYDMSISDRCLERWMNQYSYEYVRDTLLLFSERESIKNYESSIETGLKYDYVGEKILKEKNRNYALLAKKKHNWDDLEILKSYVKFKSTGQTYDYILPEKTFQEGLFHEYKKQKHSAG